MPPWSKLSKLEFDVRLQKRHSEGRVCVDIEIKNKNNKVEKHVHSSALMSNYKNDRSQNLQNLSSFEKDEVQARGVLTSQLNRTR